MAADGQGQHTGQHTGQRTGQHTGQRGGATAAVVAAACLALLAALAVPSQRKAGSLNRRTEVHALATGLGSAARLGHALWQAGLANAGAAGGAGTTSVDRAGAQARFENGYPAAADVTRFMDAAETAAFVRSGGTFRHRDVAPDARCAVRYAPPAVAGGEPLLNVATDGC